MDRWGEWVVESIGEWMEGVSGWLNGWTEGCVETCFEWRAQKGCLTVLLAFYRNVDYLHNTKRSRLLTL